jgi:hypothetical protein
MPNSINSLSPSFRDFLLLKNLITDTVIDNGLESLLSGVGKPTSIETPPVVVKPSDNIEEIGIVYQQQNTILNQYQGSAEDYSQVNIILNQSIGNVDISGPYTNTNQILNGQFYYDGLFTNSSEIRQNQTNNNLYVNIDSQVPVDIKTQSFQFNKQYTSYLDENGKLNIGGASTTALSVLGGALTGQGVLNNFDIRSSLLGRVLSTTGVINETPLGRIGDQQLLSHIGYNAAFGVQQETLGKLNLNPLSLIQGQGLVNLDYSITVPKGKTGKVLNFVSNIFGVQSPLSLLETDIFSFDSNLNPIEISNISRANQFIENSGKGQVVALFKNLSANTKVNSQGGLRQGYAPRYFDDRNFLGRNVGEELGTPQLYIRDDGNGDMIDFLNGSNNSLVQSTNYNLSKEINDDGWDKDYFQKLDYNSQKHGSFLYKDAWGWGIIDESKAVRLTKAKGQVVARINNRDSNIALAPNHDTLFEGNDKNKKTLLYKTQQLFNSGKMRTMVTGHGDNSDEEKTQINSAVSRIGNYTSKGSGVLSGDAINGENNGPENVFCRTWTTYDRYAQVGDLIRNKELIAGNSENSAIFRRNTQFSVLGTNKEKGFVRIAPYRGDKLSERIADNSDGKKIVKYAGATENKRYMFSIENLAWNDDLSNLLPCEVGPGDPLSGHRGRIMWFPPYDINFTETSSVSWDKHNFIGRGEPMYTYNNTERTGTLGWKLIIDHPNYLNFINKDADKTSANYDDYLASFFAGCIDPNYNLTPNEVNELQNEESTQPEEVIFTQPEVTPPDPFDIYFPNDVFEVDKYPTYEDGLSGSTSGTTIDYNTSPNGLNFGLNKYIESCYRYKKGNGQEVWSSTATKENCTTSKGVSGRVEPDRTDFGLNAKGSPLTPFFKPVQLDGKIYNSFRDTEYHNDLREYLKTKCKSCKVKVIGYASAVGTDEQRRNKKLSDLRADEVVKWFKENILTEPELQERIVITDSGQGSTSDRGKCDKPNEQKRVKSYLNSLNDTLGCKANRYVSVEFEIDKNLTPENQQKKEKETVPQSTRGITVPMSRFYTECDYFEHLKEESPIAYNSIREQIKYFQPALHSTTPEGFNSRLTFLHQCTRQGPTTGAKDNNNPNNLAFGRPPVCILRIGDFYHTKIIIDNVTFSYEPLVWDLNPEGVGVQPMICDVTMSFSFIGGSSLNGPINRLQNALSFNYYANTEIYDPRADTIKITENDTKGELVNGDINIGENNQLIGSNNQTGLSTKTTDEKNQISQANNVTDNNQPIEGDFEPKLKGFKFISATRTPFQFDTTGQEYDISVIMDSENIIVGNFIPENKVRPFIEKGIVISLTSIPLPDLPTNTVINNNFTYQEVISFDDIVNLVGDGFQLGTLKNGNVSLTIPNGYYKLSVTHASVVVANAVVIINDNGFIFPEGPTI